MIHLIPAAKNHAKRAILSTAARFGFIHRKFASPIDFTGSDITPIEAFRRSGGLPCVLDISVDRLRSFEMIGFSLGEGSVNPFYMTIKEIIENPSISYEATSLYRYYDLVSLSSAIDVLGVENSVLKKQDVYDADLPWRSACTSAGARREKWLALEGKENGVSLTRKDGATYCGPVSNTKFKLEINRLIGAYQSIRDMGYVVKDPNKHIFGTLLLDDKKNDFVVNIRHGQHRAAILAASGSKTLPILLRPNEIVRCSELAMLPGVQSGVFSTEDATAVFQRFLDGRVPIAVAARWGSAA